MSQKKFLGYLQKDDPLYHLVCAHILPKLSSLSISHPEFLVSRLHISNHNNKVYLYEESSSHIKFVGKFFCGASLIDKATNRAQREFNNLCYLQNQLKCAPHAIVKPIGYYPELNLLAIEYVEGTSLCKILEKAIRKGKKEALFEHLTALSHFLNAFHNQTIQNTPVDFNKDCTYFYELVNQLKTHKKICDFEAHLLYELCERWRQQSFMWQDTQVLVHGDATPPNFIFSHNQAIIAIDLERMKSSDRIFDLGRIVGELQHFFMHSKLSKQEAEPFIGHFLWQYCQGFPDQTAAFQSITRRLPFQIAITLLRIARNDWIDHHYAHLLIKEAKKTLTN